MYRVKHNNKTQNTLGAILAILMFCVNTAWALPKDGTVIAGSSTITQPSSTTLNITQTTDKSVIDWQGYSIGKSETVQYFQPGSSSISLNRVTGSDPSLIYGNLIANGSVWVINPNGLLVGKDAKINVGSFLGSTLDISNEDFMNGNYKFSNSSGILSSITNLGEINATRGGYVVLISPSITNGGNITANEGKAYLAAGDAVTLNFAGNDLIGFSIDKETAEDALGITNTGKIIANGGEVILSAKTAGDVLKTVVNNEGIIQAQTIEDKDGTIKLLGGMENNAVNVGGTLDASVPNGGNGGFIETSAANVKVTDGAIITTNAPNGKTGTWLIDPTDYTIAASGGDETGSHLAGRLGSTNITIDTSGTGTGNGDIFVNDAVSWSANTVLTLDASRNIKVNANITATGDSAGLVLTPNYNGGSGGGYSLNNGAVITLSGSSPSLSIAGNAYTVINNVTALQNISSRLSGYYALGSNIDASATSGWNDNGSGGFYGFSPIGNDSTPFTGRFDGLNHTISNLYINRPSQDYVGLFGKTDSGSIVQNMGLIGGSVTGGVELVGGLVGENYGTITNAYATGSVNGIVNYTGGLVGENDGTITNAYATGSVNGSILTGGLVGQNYGTITNAYATGSVNGVSYVGGLVGENDGTITNAYATGSVSGVSYVGGLVGISHGNGTITNAYATGSVNGMINYVGGLVGENDGTITNAYATGRVIADTYVGGLVGLNNSGTITNSFWDTITSHKTTSDGGKCLTTVQMMTQSTFTTGSPYITGTGWDIANTGGTSAVWRIYEGHTYPLLRSFLTPITVTAKSGSKGYDGTTTGIGVNYSFTPDMSKVLGTLGYTGASKNVGIYTITPGGCYSTQQGYDISYVNGTLMITPASITVAAATNSKGYDGTTTAGAAPTITSGSLYGTDSANFSETYDNKNAGTGKTLTASGTVNDGNSGNNYTVTFVKDTSGVITPASITVAAATNSKGYDGTTTAGAAPTITSGSLYGTDSANFSETYDNKNAGTGKTLTASGTVNDGNSGNNYTVTFVKDTSGVITPASLTITANNDSKTYNGLAYSGGNGVTYRGFVNSETTSVLSGTLAYGGTSQGAINAGSYTIIPGGLTSGNYNISFVNGTLTINRALLTVISGSLTGSVVKVYDGTNVATLNPSNYILTGWVGTDSATVTKTTGTYDNANAGGNKTITVSLATTDYSATGSTRLANYVLPTTITGNVGVIIPASLTITANNSSKTYDGLAYSGGNGVTYNGFVNGQTSSVLGGTLAYGGTSQGAVNAGSYTIIPSGLTSGNYTINYVDGTLSIGARNVFSSILDMYRLLDMENNDGANSPDNMTLAGLSGDGLFKPHDGHWIIEGNIFGFPGQEDEEKKLKKQKMKKMK